jgi:hypothetical protein
VFPGGNPFPCAQPRLDVVIANPAGPEKSCHDGLAREPDTVEHFRDGCLRQWSRIVPGLCLQPAKWGTVGPCMHYPQEGSKPRAGSHRREIEIIRVGRIVHVRGPCQQMSALVPECTVKPTMLAGIVPRLGKSVRCPTGHLIRRVTWEP